ncbi:uncharacterized protein LOC135380290 [Ornithodoros turicata]|uniref:uncharacterized protein LOC135380290 n=1 Tax=Ornithodoros turicata TaxID=34597 RepID=UPI00313A040D
MAHCSASPVDGTCLSHCLWMAATAGIFGKVQTCHLGTSRTRDSSKMVKRLKRLVESDMGKGQSATVVAEPQVDIGGGVLVGSHHLTYLKSRCEGNATKFARALLRVLFSPEELRGKSLFGVASNAHKNKEAKEGLDRKRVNALIVRARAWITLQTRALEALVYHLSSHQHQLLSTPPRVCRVPPPY